MNYGFLYLSLLVICGTCISGFVSKAWAQQVDQNQYNNDARKMMVVLINDGHIGRHTGLEQIHCKLKMCLQRSNMTTESGHRHLVAKKTGKYDVPSLWGSMPNVKLCRK